MEQRIWACNVPFPLLCQQQRQPARPMRASRDTRQSRLHRSAVCHEISQITMLNVCAGYYVGVATNKGHLGLYESRYTVPCEVGNTSSHAGTIKLFQSPEASALSYRFSEYEYSKSSCDCSKFLFAEANEDPAFSFCCAGQAL